MPATTIATIMTRALAALPPEASLADAARRMGSDRISSVLVLEQGQAVGIVTEQDILLAYGSNLPDSTLVTQVMGTPILSAPPETGFREAYHLMVSHHVRHLLVVDAAGQPAGLVSITDFERHLGASYYRRLKDVQSVMQHAIPTLAPQASIGEAVFAMAESGSSCAVVIEARQPQGILTERDVVRLFHDRTQRERPVREVMTPSPVSIPLGTPVAAAAERMHELGIRHLVVVDDAGAYVGLIGETDLVKHLEVQYADLSQRQIRRSRRQLAIAESRWQTIFDQTNQFMGILDGEGRLLEANASALKLIGASRESVLGQLFWDTPWWDHDPDLQARLRQAIAEAVAGRSSSFEAIHPDTTGAIHWVSFNLRRLETEPGASVRLLAEALDITERHRAETRLRLAAGVFSHSHDAILITSPDGLMVDVNPAFCQLTGYSREEAIGQHARLLNSGHHDKHYFEQMFQVVDQHGYWQGEVVNRRRDGSAAVVLMTISGIRKEDGRIGQYIGIFTDITEKKEHQKKLERMAHYDGLTGLPNRSLLMDRLNQSILQAQRRNTILAVGYLDLDGFKPVNDRYGHHAGDQLLIEVAARLRAVLRAGDTAARLGGDEFVFLINDLGSLAELENILERILLTLAQPFGIKGRNAQISASIGVTLYPEDGNDADTLLRHADQAMYEAKRRGHNRYFLFDVAQDTMARHLRQLVQDVRRGLREGEFRLHYQPKVNLCNGLVTGLEALLRWQVPGEDTPRLPAEFLPQLTNHEVVEEIGTWVLRTALEQMATWQARGLELAVSVNLAPRQLQAQDFVDQLRTTLAAHPTVSPTLLELEIVESAALEDLVHTGQVMADCRALGVNFSLDDFGTGYSSLSYFKSLPADTLKIDQSFVRDMTHEPEALAIVEGIIGLTNAFQRNVVAEGVESEAHGTLLIRLGCIQAQGYAIARPMPAADVPAWIAAFEPADAWLTAAEEQWRHEDFPLVAAEVDHWHWKKQVEARLAGQAAGTPGLPTTIPDARDCRLGRWLATQGRSAYGHLDAFKTLVHSHDAMHAMTRQLLASQDGNALEAFRAAGDQVLADLAGLQQIVARLRQMN